MSREGFIRRLDGLPRSLSDDFYMTVGEGWDRWAKECQGDLDRYLGDEPRIWREEAGAVRKVLDIYDRMLAGLGELREALADSLDQLEEAAAPEPDRPPIWDTATGHSLRRLLNEHHA